MNPGMTHDHRSPVARSATSSTPGPAAPGDEQDQVPGDAASGQKSDPSASNPGAWLVWTGGKAPAKGPTPSSR